MFCGLRRGEALGLKWEHINGLNIHVKETMAYVNREWVTQTPKTESSTRIVAMTDFMRDDLDKLLEERKRKGIISPYVLTKDDGNHYTDSSIKIILRDFFGELDIPVRSYHKLRHTYASFLIWLKTDVNITSAQLGHSNVTTTLGVYTHDFQEANSASLQVASKVGEYVKNLQ